MIVLKKGVSYLSFAAKMSEILKRDIQRAQRVQEKVMNNQYTIEAEAKLRQKVDVQSQIDQLECQMRLQISQSLKRSESKVIYLIQQAQKMYLTHQKERNTKFDIQKYNSLVVQCQKARWEFLVHRQAIGFTLKNHELVASLYRIPPKII